MAGRLLEREESTTSANSLAMPDRRHTRAALAATVILAGLIAGPLLVGIEPVGGDPDRVFRPVKAELARALHAGSLPFWSDRFGLGLPLLAESEAGAFSPPNHLLYRILGVNAAYRLSMWLHLAALAVGTYFYAIRLQIRPWGAALTGVAFPFCGFLAIHSSHEWSYQTLAYLPAALLLTDLAATTGRLRYVGGLALVLGAQWMLGHFQLQSWTNGLVLLTGIWKVLADGLPRRRVVALMAGVLIGGLIGVAQLGPSWELATISGHTQRGFQDLAYYHYPPAHLPELAIPRLFRDLPGGEEDPYWFRQATTGFESAFYVGTIPLLLAIIGTFSRNRSLDVWRLVAVLGVVLATMPRWAPGVFAKLLMLPVFGHFRCPSRYTVLASFALCLLAGAGFDKGMSSRRFAMGLALAVLLAILAFGFGTWWIQLPEWRARFAAISLEARFGPAVLSWIVALGSIILWRKGRLGPIVPVVLTAIELGALWYTSTTHWGWAIPLPEASPVLTRLTRESGPIRVGGVLDNLPVRAGITTGSPYFGFTMPMPQPILAASQPMAMTGDPAGKRWLRRLGVTHLVSDRPVAPNLGTEIWTGRDPALDVLAHRDAGITNPRKWRIIELPAPFPPAHVAGQLEWAGSFAEMTRRLSNRDSLDVALTLDTSAISSEPWPPAPNLPRLLSWNGRQAVVSHDGPCVLVVARTFYPGWIYRVNNGPDRAVLNVDAGLQGVVLPGRGTSRVAFRFAPTRFRAYAACSLAALFAALAMTLGGAWRTRGRFQTPPTA